MNLTSCRSHFGGTHVATFSLALVFFTGYIPSGLGQAVDAQWQQYVDPADAGWSVARLADARALAESKGVGAVMLIQSGHVVAAWGDITASWKTYSVRKSLVSLLFGSWIADGTIHLDSPLASLDYPPLGELTERERTATISDLLTARSGIYLPAARETATMAERRPERGAHGPGTLWYYNNWDFNTAGWLLGQMTGKDLFEMFDNRLAQPLGMQDWQVQDGYYQREPEKSAIPAYSYRLSTRDLARVGQLVLNGGVWRDRQVVSREWISESLTPRADLGNGAGYGYMWWIDGKGWLAGHLDTPIMDSIRDYAAVGARGQLLLIIPEWEVVLVHRTNTDSDGNVSDPDMLQIAEALLAARTAPPSPDAALMPLAAEPFPYDQPQMSRPDVSAIPDEERRRWTGLFQTPGPVLELYEWQSGLFARLPDRNDVELFSAHSDTMLARAVPLRLVATERSDEGKVDVFEMRLPNGINWTVGRK